MGDDLRVVNAARISYDQVSKGEEADRKLIRYLLVNRHTSPFEHVIFTFHVKCPIFVARQWQRHRVWSFNEISYRYTEAPEEAYHPTEWRGQDLKNRQASAGVLEGYDTQACDTFLSVAYEKAYAGYERLLRKGVSREQARIVLPVGAYTQFWGTIDLHNLLRFIELRDSPHAQPEIAVYASAMRHLIAPIVPWTLDAWTEIQDAYNQSN